MNRYTKIFSDTRKVFQLFILCIILFQASPTGSEADRDVFFGEIDKAGVYVIYSHGRILEGNSVQPVHPKWGVYDFPAITDALVKETDWHLIAEHRDANTDINQYSDHLVTLVMKLLEGGVKAGSINLIGFSKGGIITSLASTKLADTGINTILLASCWGKSEKLPELHIHGKLLSIYEVSDSAGTCEYLTNKDNSDFTEISISTGKEHGAFYKPLEEWVVPVKKWIKDQSL